VAVNVENGKAPTPHRERLDIRLDKNLDRLFAELHNRMPVVLKPEAWPVWLGEQPAEVPQL
jgi:hypothetical protein